MARELAATEETLVSYYKWIILSYIDGVRSVKFLKYFSILRDGRS